MDGAGPSSSADATTSQKRVQPQRKKRGGILGNEIDQTIIEAQKWRAEKPLLSPDHPIILTTDSSYAETAIDLGRIVKNFKTEQYYSRPEVIELYRKQRNIATPEVISLKDEPSLSRFRPREADKTIVSAAHSDEVYQKRHKALETHERRERMRELEMMKTDYGKLKERIKFLEKIEFTAFNTLGPESFSPLPEPVDLSSPYSEEAQIEGERRREEMLEGARSLDERYQFLLGDELKQKKGPKAAARRPPTPAKVVPVDEAMDVEVVADVEGGQDEEEQPPPKPKNRGGRPRVQHPPSVGAASSSAPNAVASTSTGRSGRRSRGSAVPTIVGKGKKRAVSPLPVEQAPRRTPSPPPPSPPASTARAVSVNVADSNGVSMVVSDVRTPMSPSPAPYRRVVLVNEDVDMSMDMEVEEVDDTEGIGRSHAEEEHVHPPPLLPKPNRSSKFRVSVDGGIYVRGKGRKRAASPLSSPLTPKRIPTPVAPPTAPPPAPTGVEEPEPSGVPMNMPDVRTPVPSASMPSRPQMVEFVPTSHHSIILESQHPFVVPPIHLQPEHPPVFREDIVEEEFESRPKKRLRVSEAPSDRQPTPPPQSPPKQLGRALTPSHQLRQPSLPPIESLSSAELINEEPVPESRAATRRRKATPEPTPEPEPVEAAQEAEPEKEAEHEQEHQAEPEPEFDHEHEGGPDREHEPETEPEVVMDVVSESPSEEPAPAPDVAPTPEPVTEPTLDSNETLDEPVLEPSPEPPTKPEPAESPEPIPGSSEMVPEPLPSEPRVLSEAPTASAPSPSIKFTEETPSMYTASPAPEAMADATHGRGRGRGRGGRSRGGRLSAAGGRRGRSASVAVPRARATRRVPDPTIVQIARRNVGVGHRAQRRTHAFGAKLPSVLLSPDEYDYELPDYIVGMAEFEPDGSPDEDESAESDKSRKGIPDLLHWISGSNDTSNPMSPDVDATGPSPSPPPRDPDSDNL